VPIDDVNRCLLLLLSLFSSLLFSLLLSAGSAVAPLSSSSCVPLALVHAPTVASGNDDDDDAVSRHPLPAAAPFVLAIVAAAVCPLSRWLVLAARAVRSNTQTQSYSKEEREAAPLSSPFSSERGFEERETKANPQTKVPSQWRPRPARLPC